MKNNKKAIIKFEKILELESDLFSTFNSYINIGKCYYELGLNEIGLNKFLNAKKLAEKEKNASLINKADEFISIIK